MASFGKFFAKFQRKTRRVRKGNSNIMKKVRDIGITFVNNVEISAQEAINIILQLPMRKSSRNNSNSSIYKTDARDQWYGK